MGLRFDRFKKILFYQKLRAIEVGKTDFFAES